MAMLHERRAIGLRSAVLVAARRRELCLRAVVRNLLPERTAVYLEYAMAGAPVSNAAPDAESPRPRPR